MANFGVIVRLVPRPNQALGQPLQYCAQSFSFSENQEWKNLGVLDLSEGEMIWTPFPEFQDVISNLETTKHDFQASELGSRAPVLNVKLRIKYLARKILDGRYTVNETIPNALAFKEGDLMPVFLGDR